MAKPHRHKREAARRLYLTGELDTSAEIAARLGVKAHTVGRWRREEDWDGLRLKTDRRAAELFVEKIATDRVTLNVRHYRYWELLGAKAVESLKSTKVLDSRELDRHASILERMQKGQRLSKGMSVQGETEEAIRAQSQASIRRLVDAFIGAVKENVSDEEARDRIRRSIHEALPGAAADGVGDPGDASDD